MGRKEFVWNDVKVDANAGQAYGIAGARLKSRMLDPIISALDNIQKTNELNAQRESDANTGSYLDQVLQGKKISPTGLYDAEKIAKARYNYKQDELANARANEGLTIRRANSGRAAEGLNLRRKQDDRAQKTWDIEYGGGGGDLPPMPTFGAAKQVDPATGQVVSSTVGLAQNQPQQPYPYSAGNSDSDGSDMLMSAIARNESMRGAPAITDQRIASDAQNIAGRTAFPVGPAIASNDDSIQPYMLPEVPDVQEGSNYLDSALANRQTQNDPNNMSTLQLAQAMSNEGETIPDAMNGGSGPRTANVDQNSSIGVPNTISEPPSLAQTQQTAEEWKPRGYGKVIQKKIDNIKTNNEKYDAYASSMEQWAGNSKRKQAIAKRRVELLKKSLDKRSKFTTKEQASINRIDNLNDVNYMRSQGYDKNGKSLDSENDITLKSFTYTDPTTGQQQTEYRGVDQYGNIVDQKGAPTGEKSIGSKEPTLNQDDKKFLAGFKALKKPFNNVNSSMSRNEDIFGPIASWFDRGDGERSTSGIGQLLATDDSKDAARFDSDMNRLKSEVIKSMGANPSDRDLRIIESMIPSRVDEPDVAQEKATAFKSWYYNKQAEKINRLLGTNPSVAKRTIFNTEGKVNKGLVPGYELIRENGTYKYIPVQNQNRR